MKCGRFGVTCRTDSCSLPTPSGRRRAPLGASPRPRAACHPGPEAARQPFPGAPWLLPGPASLKHPPGQSTAATHSERHAACDPVLAGSPASRSNGAACVGESPSGAANSPSPGSAAAGVPTLRATPDPGPHVPSPVFCWAPHRAGRAPGGQSSRAASLGQARGWGAGPESRGLALTPRRSLSLSNGTRESPRGPSSALPFRDESWTRYPGQHRPTRRPPDTDHGHAPRREGPGILTGSQSSAGQRGRLPVRK